MLNYVQVKEQSFIDIEETPRSTSIRKSKASWNHSETHTVDTQNLLPDSKLDKGSEGNQKAKQHIADRHVISDNNPESDHVEHQGDRPNRSNQSVSNKNVLKDVVTEEPSTQKKLEKTQKDLENLTKNGKKTAQKVLTEIEKFTKEIKENSELSCVCTTRVNVEATLKTLLFGSVCIAATFNLVAFLIDEYEKNGFSEKFAKEATTTLGAAIAVAVMYLEGTVNLIEQLRTWSKKNKTSLPQLMQKSIKSLNDNVASQCRLNNALPLLGKGLKLTTMGSIIVFSVLLDSINASLAASGLFASKGAGVFMGIMTGISKSMVPLTQLETSWQTIAAPALVLKKGQFHSQDEIESLLQNLKDITESAKGNGTNRIFRGNSQQACELIQIENPKVNQLIDLLQQSAIQVKAHKIGEQDLSTLKQLCRAYANNENMLTTETMRLLNDLPIASKKSRQWAGLSLVIQILGGALAGFSLGAVMGIPAKLRYYNAELSICLELMKEAMLVNDSVSLAAAENWTLSAALNMTDMLSLNSLGNLTSLTLNNIGNQTDNELMVDILFKNASVEELSLACADFGFEIMPFSSLKSMLFSISYICGALALYGGLRKTFNSVAELPRHFYEITKSIIDACKGNYHLPKNSKKILASMFSLIGTSCYMKMLVDSTQQIIDVTVIEAIAGFTTSFIPGGEMVMLWIAIASCFGILYGGAQSGFESLFKIIERLHLNRKLVQTDEFDEPDESDEFDNVNQENPDGPDAVESFDDDKSVDANKSFDDNKPYVTDDLGKAIHQEPNPINQILRDLNAEQDNDTSQNMSVETNPDSSNICFDEFNSEFKQKPSSLFKKGPSKSSLNG